MAVCDAGIAPPVRHAWVAALASNWEAACPDAGADAALADARALEQAVFVAARAAAETSVLHHVAGAAAAAVTALRIADGVRRGAEAAAYERAAKRLLAAVCNNGAALRARYGDDVTVLVALDDAHLADGCAAAEWLARAREDAALAHKLTQETDAVSDYTLQVCTRCKSRDVVTEDKQMRSGDEGGTMFWTCNACGTRGKRNS